MSARQISVNKIRRLASLHGCNNPLPISHLGRALSISRGTVRRYCVHLMKSGYSYSEFATLPSKEIRAVLRQETARQNPPNRHHALMLVFPKVHEGLYQGSANLRNSWNQYRNRNPGGYGYSQFVLNFRTWQKSQGLQADRCYRWRVIHIHEEDLVEFKKWRRSNSRINWAMAVVMLDSNKGAGLTHLCSKIEKSPRLVRRWLEAYKQRGIDGLRRREEKRLNPDKVLEMETKRDRIIKVLHESPHLHVINRSSWSLEALARAYKRQYGESIGRSTISDYVRDEGYTFRKARRVLTSPDPNYREKLQQITEILSNLQEDEKFFSVDEFGPFSVKMQGGSTLTRKGTTRVIPKRQRSRGCLIITGALELSTNLMTHFYSEKKNTEEMIKLLEILFASILPSAVCTSRGMWRPGTFRESLKSAFLK